MNSVDAETNTDKVNRANVSVQAPHDFYALQSKKQSFMSLVLKKQIECVFKVLNGTGPESTTTSVLATTASEQKVSIKQSIQVAIPGIEQVNIIGMYHT